MSFVGLLILAGVYRSCGESTAQLWSVEDGRAIFRATMSLRRFHTISRVLRFDDKERRKTQRRTDKLAPIRSLWDMWTKRLQEAFVPYENVTVDEQLVKFRGRCPFRQYIPSKPGKYGIKVWVCADSKTIYAYNMQV